MKKITLVLIIAALAIMASASVVRAGSFSQQVGDYPVIEYQGKCIIYSKFIEDSGENYNLKVLNININNNSIPVVFKCELLIHNKPVFRCSLENMCISYFSAVLQTQDPSDKSPNLDLDTRRTNTSDADSDGVPDIYDNCQGPSNPDPKNIDTDGDGKGDKCDVDFSYHPHAKAFGEADATLCINADPTSCPSATTPPSTPATDTDGDGIADTADNCPGADHPDPLNADTDGDGIGDACDKCDTPSDEIDIVDADGCTPAPVIPVDLDRDDDGVTDDKDLCDATPTDAVVDDTGCQVASESHSGCSMLGNSTTNLIFMVPLIPLLWRRKLSDL